MSNGSKCFPHPLRRPFTFMCRSAVRCARTAAVIPLSRKRMSRLTIIPMSYGAKSNWSHARHLRLLPCITEDDALRAELIERIMCHLVVDIEEVCARRGASINGLSPVLARLQTLADDGIVRLEGPRVEVVADARLLVRSVAAAFDAYLLQSSRTYSSAV